MQSYALWIQQKYQEERAKRVRPDGSSQYIELSRTDKFQNFLDDPWVDNKEDEINFDGSHFKFLIVGTGYGGILLAVRLIEAGIPASDVHLVDAAGGFGGTWYWNRYPGLMCDIESYIYMPLLEEMGYVPENKYGELLFLGGELLHLLLQATDDAFQHMDQNFETMPMLSLTSGVSKTRLYSGMR